MKALVFVVLAFLLAGCVSEPGGSLGAGSANFQRCASQCGSGPGAGELCMDGCRVQEAEDAKDTSFCDRLYKRENVPSCYGTVAKSAGDIKICDRLADAGNRSYCIAVFGGPSTN
ncbi:MAG: hypothetical protein AB1529_04095 [Candidatus Micrarchaeota archaeon]